MSFGHSRRSPGKLALTLLKAFLHKHEANSYSTRTITALALAVSALGYGGIISLYTYIFMTQAVFTTKIIPQVWRIFTAFLITKPKFAILMDPYFMYQYGSAIERESSRFSQPGDFFMYTIFCGSVIVVSFETRFLVIVRLFAFRIPTNMLRIDTSVYEGISSTHHLGLSARPAKNF